MRRGEGKGWKGGGGRPLLWQLLSYAVVVAGSAYLVPALLLPDTSAGGEAASHQLGKGGGWVEVGGEMESKYRQMSAPALTPPRHQSTASVGGREHMVLPSWSPDSADLHLDIYLSTYQYKRHSRAICLVLPWARWSRPTLSAMKHNIQMCKWVKQDTR